MNSPNRLFICWVKMIQVCGLTGWYLSRTGKFARVGLCLITVPYLSCDFVQFHSMKWKIKKIIFELEYVVYTSWTFIYFIYLFFWSSISRGFTVHRPASWVLRCRVSGSDADGADRNRHHVALQLAAVEIATSQQQFPHHSGFLTMALRVNLELVASGW